MTAVVRSGEARRISRPDGDAGAVGPGSSPVSEGSTRSVTLGGSLGLFFAAIGLLIGRRVLTDNSFLTHYATGRLILERGSVPTVDPYSYTAAGEPWVVQSWLASVLYAGADALLGGFAIRLLNGVVCAAIAYCIWVLASRRNQQVFVPLALTGSAMIIGALMWSSRPLLFGILGILLVQAVLDGVVKAPWLLPVMWVWVNTHGSFPLAGVLVCATALGAWLDDRRRPPRHELTVLGWVTGGILLGAANPLGPRLLWFPVQLLGRSETLENVVEWRPLAFEGLIPWVFLAFVCSFAVSVSRQFRWRELVPAAVFVVAALMAVRNVVAASALLAVYSATNITLPRSTLRTTLGGPLPRVLGAASIALAAIAGLSALGSPLDLHEYPVAEFDRLEADGTLAGNPRMLHPDTAGNYLTLRLGPENRVFVDDRYDFYPEQVVDDLELLLYGGDFQAVIDRYQPTVIVWKRGGGFEAWLDLHPAWDVSVPIEIDDPLTGDSEPSDWFIARRR